MTNKKVLLVAANTTTHKTLGFPMGFWAAELTHPYAELAAHGYDITIASIDGGEIRPDSYSDPNDESGYSAQDFVSRGFLASPTHLELLKNTVSIAEVDADEYDAIFVIGGQAPMFTFRENKTLQTLIRQFYEAGKPTAALCHGVAALIDVTLSNGKRLIQGKTITGFSLAEDKLSEEAIGSQIFDWYIEEEAIAAGANFVHKDPWTNYATSDSNLITGQQQNSGATVAQMVIQQLESNTTGTE